jgi:hypothetical protein
MFVLVVTWMPKNGVSKLDRLAAGEEVDEEVVIPPVLQHLPNLATYYTNKGGHTYGSAAIACGILAYRGLALSEQRKRESGDPAYQLPLQIHDRRSASDAEPIYVKVTSKKPR